MGSAEADLAHVLEQMRRERERLVAAIGGLTPDDMRRERPGGWSVGRVLRHVIESEAIYAKVLAHQRGVAAPECDVSEPHDGPSAVAALRVTRAAVSGLAGGIEADTLYRLVRLGHEEYSPLSVFENIAAHDREHIGQIGELLRRSNTTPSPPLPAGVAIRAAREADLSAIVAIYNHYIVNTPITFDLEPYTVESRRPWFSQFRDEGRHRLLVAETDGTVRAYAGTHQFRTKAAYDTTVETTIYCAPDAAGRGIGRALYGVLFDLLRDEDIHAYIAGITLPNETSIALHERFGFHAAGVMHGVGRKFSQLWDVGWYERVAR